MTFKTQTINQCVWVTAVYLFPEAYLYASYHTLQQVPPHLLRAALLPRCNTKTARDAALRLLRVLVLHDAANLSIGLHVVKRLHLTGNGPMLDHLPQNAIR